MANLTAKQEAFCQAFMTSKNASEAYRLSYDAGRMKPESVNRKAKELMDNVKIAARIEELRGKVEKKTLNTVEDLLQELDEAREVALGALIPQSSAAVSAIMAKAKLLGLDINKTELTGKGGKDFFPSNPRELTDEELANIASNGGTGTPDKA